MSAIENGISAATEAIGSVSDSVNDLVASKRQFIIKQISNVFLLLVILLVFGCFDFLHLQFHYEYLIDANYWVNIGVKAVADICAYNIGVNFIIDDVIKRNKTLSNLQVQYERLNELKQEDFSQFIDIYNKEQRIIAYKNYINRKIYTLNKHSRRSDRLAYSKFVYEEGMVLKGYTKKRYELEQMKLDEFIKENIDNLEIPYRDVDAAVFEVEINGTEKIIQNKVTGSLTKGRAIASLSTMLGVVAFSIIINPIALAPNKEEFVDGAVAAANYAMSIASDIGIIVWQFTRGILGTHKIVSNQITVPLAERVKILKKYYEWRKRTGKEVPEYYLNLFKEKKEEIIEITEEQFNNLNHNENNL